MTWKLNIQPKPNYRRPNHFNNEISVPEPDDSISVFDVEKTESKGTNEYPFIVFLWWCAKTIDNFFFVVFSEQ